VCIRFLTLIEDDIQHLQFRVGGFFLNNLLLQNHCENIDNILELKQCLT